MQNRFVFLGVVAAMTLTLTWPTAGADVHDTAPATDMAEAPSRSFAGKILTTTNASRYTYVEIDTGKEKLWAAAPATTVKVGDTVSIVGGMPTRGFYSPTLKRKFEEIYFVSQITMPGGAPPAPDALPPGHPTVRSDAAATKMDFSGIQKPDGGKTVAEIWAERSKLSGKPVVVRAKVMRVIPKIMGHDFLHLRDGTGGAGENDLTVTTKDVVKVGSIVTARGVLSTDKDFGSGYKYDVIIEDAAITK